MVKLWKDSMKSFGSHLDPEKDEQLQWIKIEVDNNVRRLVRHIKRINKDVNQKKKSELIQLVEDFHKKYQSLYAHYENLKGSVWKKIHGEEEDSSSSVSETESYHSFDEAGSSTSEPKNSPQRQRSNQMSESSDSDDAILKDILTSTSEIREASTLESLPSPSQTEDSVEMIEDITSETELADDVEQNLIQESAWLRDKLSKREEELLSLTERHEIYEDEASAKITDLEDQAYCTKVEFQIFCDQVHFLQQELERMGLQKADIELLMEKKTRKVSECHVQIDNLKANLARTTEDKQLMDMEADVSSLCSQKKNLEEQITSINHEAEKLRMEKNDLLARITELENTLKERSDKFSALQKKLEANEKEMSDQVRSLTAHVKNVQKELDSLQNEKKQLRLHLDKEKQMHSQSINQKDKHNVNSQNKIADQYKRLKAKEDTLNKLSEEQNQIKTRFSSSKINLQTAERKMEEMADEFYKKCEDNLRILSRRILVAEQLQIENMDWCRKTKEKYEQECMDLKEKMTTHEVALRKIKDMSLSANNILNKLDAMALKFEESSANFPSRISKVSCELKFAKDWVLRRNKSIKHVREDSDCLLVQLDDKEAEILRSRGKVWKLKNKVRELEKIMKEKEDGMLGLEEEKREAIRQLCVWIDHHRSRSDYYKKMLSEMTFKSQRES